MTDQLGAASLRPARTDTCAYTKAGHLAGDWFAHPVHKIGTERDCRRCGKPSMLPDCTGRPCHKVCAEAEDIQ